MSVSIETHQPRVSSMQTVPKPWETRASVSQDFLDKDQWGPDIWGIVPEYP